MVSALLPYDLETPALNLGILHQNILAVQVLKNIFL